MNITVKDIVKVCNGDLLFGDENIVCENFSKDTRTIEKNDVFLGIKGENFDGNTMFESAFEKGAKVCILDNIELSKEIEEKYKDKCIIKVADTIKALQQIAAYKRSLYNIPVIAITGSVGKTSTKDIIASVVGTAFNVLKTEGNLNNHIGLPLTILKLKDHNALVVEMGMSHLGEISALSKIAKPNIAVITNVGTAHIGNLGSRENILKAKLEIIDGLADGGTLIINNDNDMLNAWNQDTTKNLKVVTYGIDNQSDVMASNIEYGELSSTFSVESSKVMVPVGGKHFVYNALSAISVGKVLKIDFEKIQNGIEKFELSKNRMEIFKVNGVTVVNDCYNANFDSMKAGIESIAKMDGVRKIAVLGDMLELGEYSKELHQNVGVEVAKNNIDVLVTVGNEAKYIASTAIENNMKKDNVHTYENNLQAIEFIKSIAKEGDVILVKASNGMKFIEIVNSLKNID